MEFRQLDEILNLEIGKSITATRLLRAEESILEDHFPLFPVLPGVLMLEACFQAGMWLILATEEFKLPLIILKSARNVKYSDFVAPGDTLTVTMDIVKHEQRTTSFKAKGVVSGPDREANAFSGRLVLERSTVEERYPVRGPSQYALVYGLKEKLEDLMAGVHAVNREKTEAQEH